MSKVNGSRVSISSRKEDNGFLDEGFHTVHSNEIFSLLPDLMQIVAVIPIATMHLICQVLSKSIQRQALGYMKSDSISRGNITAPNLTRVSLQNSAVIRLEMFQVLNHTQQSENWERRKTSTISSTRKDVVTEGEKQEKGRRRGKGEKISHNADEQSHKHQRERHKARSASVPQNCFSGLVLFLPKSKDIQRTANWEHLTQQSD